MTPTSTGLSSGESWYEAVHRRRATIEIVRGLTSWEKIRLIGRIAYAFVVQFDRQRQPYATTLGQFDLDRSFCWIGKWLLTLTPYQILVEPTRTRIGFSCNLLKIIPHISKS
jgi:hypothetical protein